MYVSFKILYKFLGFQLISGCFDEVVEVDKITSSPKHSSNTDNSLQLTTRDDIFLLFLRFPCLMTCIYMSCCVDRGV